MLRLKNIKKSYKIAGKDIEVLKGLDLSFRKNEFVSILGPSGCGKTTTLNIIGGLDTYNEGDLIIEGKSTKDFKDHDWDVYRNQSIGFIFQSYNLIPHESVLENVELALTISGVSIEERKRRAKEALDKVGLEGEYNKKPNQLSGGQCQRVAIARALVNEPQILLADEPTGALDTKTSVQIMELIKEIAKERLVIMVTHNPELAENYSTRIINLLDGEVTSDSNPYSEEDEIAEVKLLTLSEKAKETKAKMSLFTAFKLSSKNLWSKRKRTIMTVIAGSIGIIGISAVLAISSGVKGYIASMEDDMLSGNPITISETTLDMTSIMSSMSMSQKIDFNNIEGSINVDTVMKYFIENYVNNSSIITNDIKQEYIDYVLQMDESFYSAINLNYGIDVSNNIYTDFHNGDKSKNASLSAIKSTYTGLLGKTEVAQYSSVITSLDDVFAQAPSDTDYILSQYDILSGNIAKGKNQIMIVVDKDTALTDIALAELGYYNSDDFIEIVQGYLDSSDSNYEGHFSYEELLGKKFTYYNNDTVFNVTQTGVTYNPYSTDFDSGLDLEVVGILRPKEEINYGCLSSGFYYTEELTKYIFEENFESKIVKFIKDMDKDEIQGVIQDGVILAGVTYDISYSYNGLEFTEKNVLGKTNMMSSMMGSMGGSTSSVSTYSLSLRNLGGNNLANKITIYPVNFEQKDLVVNYLDIWNSSDDVIVNGVTLKAEDRNQIVYTDTLSLIISIISSIVDIITIALIAFTALSLVVSCVMIAIITYVSVVERVKEIGVIRSLGGRKKDVSHLFNAETLIIGLASGLFGVIFTYFISLIVNLALNGVIGTNIMSLPITNALIMILLSIVLTVLSGLIPAKKAANQNPVEALRTE